VAQLSANEIALRQELRTDVQGLAGEIGERNMWLFDRLAAAADFIEASLAGARLQTRRQSYQLDGRACHNIEAEIPGATPQIVLVGAHYDSVIGSPGANDNGSGVAAMLALARRFAKTSASLTLRFVGFVNEEPPYFLTPQMGSLVYAGACRERSDRIAAMISLETIGYFSDAPHSQTYPLPGFGAFYPTTANFIGFVANSRSRALLRRTVSIFREQNKIPAEAAALPPFVPGVGWSDHWSFWQYRYPALMVTDTAPFRYPHYHLPTDTPDKLDYDRFTLVVSGMENVIADLAGVAR
jgi:Zn-dependent M28 family amino/carboxypeptidase